MYDRAAFAAEFAVPRETLARFDAYAELLLRHAAHTNLVGRATLADLWSRHFRDSAQLSALGQGEGSWLDMGSGAGFPGLVLALLDRGPMHLVEATAKKCRFLGEVVAAASPGVDVFIHNGRLEALPPFRASFIVARACAALPQLLAWGLPFAASDTLWLLPKGRNAAAEIAAARKAFRFSLDMSQSRSDARGRILLLRKVKRT